MADLRTITEKGTELKELYKKVTAELNWLRKTVEILEPVDGQQGGSVGPLREIMREKEEQLLGLMAELSFAKVELPEHEEFITNFFNTTETFLPGLFVCHENPKIPATNNDMERFLRDAKGKYRRITGRRNWSNYVLRYGAYAVLHDPNESELELFIRFGFSDREALERSKDHWKRNQRRRERRRRFRKDPDGYLKRLEQLWEKGHSDS